MDLMDIKQSKIPVKIKFTKVEPNSSKEAEGDGVKGRIRKVDDNVEDTDTKGPRKTKTRFFSPKPKRRNPQKRIKSKQENKGQKTENWQMRRYQKRTRLNIAIK